MIFILLSLCSLMVASTKVAPLDSTLPEDPTSTAGSIQWPRITLTADLPAKDQLLGSIINLAQAHFIHGEQDLSETVACTVHSLLLMHTSKASLYHLVNNPDANQSMTQTFAQHILCTKWEHEASDLHKKTVDLLQKDVIEQTPPYSYPHRKELASLLITPDTTPIIRFLETLLSQTNSPVVRAPLEVLLQLNWEEVFRTLTDHIFHPLFKTAMSHCNNSVLLASKLVHATSIDDLTHAQKELIIKTHPHVDMRPAFLYKKHIITKTTAATPRAHGTQDTGSN